MIISYPLQDAKTIEEGLGRVASHKDEQVYWAKISAFVPQACYVSLGASNDLESQVNLDACAKDGVAVFRRLSGGEAVFLSPLCVVFSHILISPEVPKTADFFSHNLNSITEQLTQAGLQGITRRGISDLAIQNRKFLGCAIYRKVGLILFQAVINVEEDPAVIGKYLYHPPREPDYRSARNHASFITSLKEQGYGGTPAELAELLNRIEPASPY